MQWETIEADDLFGVNKLVRLCVEVLKYVQDRNKVEIIVIEDYGFGGKFFNVDVAELVGMLKVMFKYHNIKSKIVFLAPNTTKKCITGNGKAKKSAMVKGIKQILNLDKKVKLVSHEADAIALIVTIQKYLTKGFNEEDTRKIQARSYDN